MTACADQNLLLGGLVDGELDAANTALAEAHVTRCEGCREELERLQAVRSLMAMDGMRRQLALSQQIMTVMSASKDAYEQGKGLDAKLTAPPAHVASKVAKTLRKEIADLAGASKDASIGLSGGSYAVPAVKGATSFSRINGQASALLEMVESSSDQAPVPSLYRTYADLCRDFNATLAAWQSLQAKVGQLNVDGARAGDGTLAPARCQVSRVPQTAANYR